MLFFIMKLPEGWLDHQNHPTVGTYGIAYFAEYLESFISYLVRLWHYLGIISLLEILDEAHS